VPLDPQLALWLAVAAALGLAAAPAAAAAVERWPRGEAVLRPLPGLSRSALALAPACAAAAAGGVLARGPGLGGVGAAALLLALVPVVLIDIRHRLIPDVLVLPAAAVALAAAVAAEPARWWAPAACGLGAAAFLLVPWLLRPGAMGLGDVKLALAMGAALGASVVPALLAAFAAAAAACGALVVRHGARARGTAIPFGPFLAAGAVVGLLWGPALLGWLAGGAP
jgi:prepilin signal peptidase PulO-like enzyme (type II secretory pathway)